MVLGAILVAVANYYQLRFLFRNVELENPHSPEAAALKTEIFIWQRTANKLSGTSEEEAHVKALLQQKVTQLRLLLEDAEARGCVARWGGDRGRASCWC